MKTSNNLAILEPSSKRLRFEIKKKKKIRMTHCNCREFK